jgi:hypothetical protein
MKRILYLTIVGFFALQTIAFAEWIKGTVLSVDEQNNQITIKRSNEMLDTNKNLPAQVLDRMELKVNENADLKNVSSLSELQPGSEVRVNIRQNPQNPEVTAWEATSIESTADIKKELRMNEPAADIDADIDADTDVDVQTNPDGSTSVDVETE